MGQAEAAVDEVVGMIEPGELRPEMQRPYAWCFLVGRRKAIAEPLNDFFGTVPT